MRIKFRFLVSIFVSVAVSAVIAYFAFSVLQSINGELARGQKYNEVINKAFALNILIATFKEESGPRDTQQIGDVRKTLSRLLDNLSSADAREESLIRQIRRNNQELGPLLDQFLVQKGAPGSSLETERKNMLAAQLWTKVRFITDDTNRLAEISQSRISSAQGKAGAAVLALIAAVILTNATISFFSSRSIVGDVGRLAQGVGHISGGDLGHRVEILGKNELADLARRFNRMAESLQAADDRRKEYTQKIEQSNRELQDFAFVASHDLQEPLRKIQSFGERLKAKYDASLGDEGRDYVGRMQEAARRMQSLIQALLGYSRVATKAEPFSPVDLNPLLREVLSDLETTIAETGGQVQTENLATLEADPSQMRQLFQNLVGNALKFRREEKPVIKVYGRSGSSQAGGPPEMRYRIFVEDNGIGFEEKYLDRIFTPFQRLHGRGVYEGTGMGLAICRKIVERHGGDITAKSIPGKGSTFIVTLPLRRPKGGEVL